MNLAVVIPALNEAVTIERVIQDVYKNTRTHTTRIVVADNGSVDKTSEISRKSGAEVVKIPIRGYGLACQGAIRLLDGWPDIILFLDGDGSSPASEISSILGPLLGGENDLAIGQRAGYPNMTSAQRWGTWLATRLIYMRWGVNFQDIGPFRAIRYGAYRKVAMHDRTWGWTVEMQISAVLKGLQVIEVPVGWLPRKGGTSKISGTILGITRAGLKILWTIGRHALRPAPTVSQINSFEVWDHKRETSS